MLLKDYVVYYLTEVMLSDMPIATFSFYFDIYNKCYWQKMLQVIGVEEKQLPPLAEPCVVAGKLTAELTDRLGLTMAPDINIGTLDHFAEMIGTGNIATGGGAKSDIWYQLQADITGLPILIPEEKEAACLGAAIIAAVADGAAADLKAASGLIGIKKRFEPHYSEETERKYRRFCRLYAMSMEICEDNV